MILSSGCVYVCVSVDSLTSTTVNSVDMCIADRSGSLINTDSLIKAALLLLQVFLQFPHMVISWM